MGKGVGGGVRCEVLTVSKPVGRGRDGRLLGARSHGEGLADDDPADGTPGADYGASAHKNFIP